MDKATATIALQFMNRVYIGPQNTAQEIQAWNHVVETLNQIIKTQDAVEHEAVTQ